MSSKPNTSEQVRILHSLFASGELIHPYLEQEYFREGKNNSTVSSFVDLSASIAICCGVAEVSTPNTKKDDDLIVEQPVFDSDVCRRRMQLAAEIGGWKEGVNGNDVYSRKHIVLILCDGMGNSCLEQAFVNGETSSFLMKHNQPARIRAVFPSTTPAALTTLATASWPGRHGMPGWNLRDKSGVDFPGNSDSGGPTVQLLALSDRIKDARSGVSTQKLGFDTWDKVFVEIPWSRRILDRSDQSRETKKQSNTIRKMIYINAYNGDDYQNWSQGSKSEGTNFSSWQMGNLATRDDNASPFDTAKIEETAYDTLGEPEGATNAINFFRNGLDAALSKIAEAERKDESTFTYLYTAHPDKHMHALGVEHPKVQQVIRGIDSEIERFWNLLSDRNALLTRFDKNDGTNEESKRAKMTPKSIDASVVVTADHGHITVDPKHMILLPSDVLDCLEYANIGVHGKGRHGYLHCRSGLQSILLRRWNSHNTLLEHFIILTVDEAISNGLFGPQSMRQEVRPRLGDFVVISKGKHTLVTPNEAETYQNTCRCQGAHGSLLPEEMMIPFILLERR